jgi:hypothetical protein
VTVSFIDGGNWSFLEKTIDLSQITDERYHQHYVITFISDLRQVSGFLQETPVSSINKTDRHDLAEILSKVALNTGTLALYYNVCYYYVMISVLA